MSQLIAGNDVAISYLPPTLHHLVMRPALDAGVNVVTASYISETTQKFHEEAQEKGLVILNGMGIDPGVDIMSTMQIKDRVEAEGGKIVKYESWCGGLPNAECADNPLGYKFSWDPAAVFRTCRNPATFMKGGEIITIPGDRLLIDGVETKDFHKAYRIEGYPNRDSVSFREMFGMTDAKCFVRGTLRYENFSTIILGLIEIGILEEVEIPTEVERTPLGLMRFLSEKSAGDSSPRFTSHINELDFPNVEAREICASLLSNITETRPEVVREIIRSWLFFGLFSTTPLSERSTTFLQAFSEIAVEKLSYQEGERDVIIMKHIFRINTSVGKKRTLHSTYVGVGQPQGQGPTIMAQTVGYTTAIGAELILEGMVQEKGVIMPTTPDIYEPALQRLREKFGIELKEEYV